MEPIDAFTPPTTPTTPVYIDANVVPGCDCGCALDGPFSDHFNTYSAVKENVADAKERFEIERTGTGHVFNTVDEIPQWLFKIMDKSLFKKQTYGQSHVCTVSPQDMLIHFDNVDWNNHYSLFNNNKQELLSLLPARFRIYPHMCSNGQLLVLLGSWSRVLSRIVSGVLAGEYDIPDDFNHTTLEVVQLPFTYHWEWKVYFGYKDHPKIKISEEKKERHSCLIIQSMTPATYVAYASGDCAFGYEDVVPLTYPSYYSAFISSQYARDYQELLFENFSQNIKRARIALNSVGFDYLTREDIEIGDLFCFRSGPVKINKLLVHYCKELNRPAFDLEKERRKSVHPSEMALVRITPIDEDYCICSKDHRCITRLLAGVPKIAPCWVYATRSIDLHCKTGNKFRRVKRAPLEDLSIEEPDAKKPKTD